MAVLSIAVPNKGRLSRKAINILNAIGFGIPEDPGRTLVMDIGKGRYKVLFARADDIPEFVENQVVDVGITGLDLVREDGRKVDKLQDLGFGRCRLVIAVSEDSPVDGVEKIPEGSRIATSFPNITRSYFKKMGKKVDIIPMTGATEIAPNIGVAEFITDLTETGSTLKMNRLKEIGTILESQAVLIANRSSLKEKAEQIEEIQSAVESVLNAKRKRYLMANVPKTGLEELQQLLPGISGPTVMNIIGREDVVAVHAVADEDEVNGIITILKSIGASGILVLPIERLIP
ncbi:MAG TPA: ATP phosphoribosyltransferase [Euryarchaeota archaeon]|nr:ATP phosphoribosyltransferase [Euryarchaeota archaeon]